jgi:dienelactone hydrolase
VSAHRTTLLGAALALAWAGTAHAQVAPEQARSTALRALDALDAGQYAQVEALFGADMAQAVPADKLQAVWESLPAQAGAATGRGEARTSTQGDTALVQVPLHHARAELLARFAIDADGKIVGFLVAPADAHAAAPAPAVDADAAYAETDFSVGTGDTALPGTLALPKGNGPFPALVLVHGSGPHDRDESIGPNKPFLDIARGLAAQGIAVLRYDKRSKARPQDFAGNDYTIDDETTDDAVAAVDALRKVDGIDPQRVFVLGHSQGGMLAPRIAAKSDGVAGLVLLAAPARPLLDIVIEQNRRLAVLDDARTSDAERAAIDKLVEQVRLSRDTATDAKTKTVMDLPAGYWRSTDAVDPVAEAQQAKRPMLVLQGARDIQVVDADWQRWRGGFNGDDTVQFKLYDTLNHLGIAGEGEGSLAEYGTPGHVDAQLITDVATWIKAH